MKGGRLSIPEDVAATLDFSLVLRASICGLLACNGFDALVREPWVCGRTFPHYDHRNVLARHVKCYCRQLLCASRRALTTNETPIRFSKFLAERLLISMRVLPAFAPNRGVCKDMHTELSKDRAMIGNGGLNRDVHMNIDVGQHKVQQTITSSGAAYVLLKHVCCTNSFQNPPLLADTVRTMKPSCYMDVEVADDYGAYCGFTVRCKFLDECPYAVQLLSRMPIPDTE